MVTEGREWSGGSLLLVTSLGSCLLYFLLSQMFHKLPGRKKQSIAVAAAANLLPFYLLLLPLSSQPYFPLPLLLDS